ncbi:MAG TPA: alpha/beta hydrolase [Candidatus Limnocylindria bacterium]|nr:alpha/beta hydrolase [Candidatus Limnocylindria bacterium]
MAKRLPRARTLKGDPALAHYYSEPSDGGAGAAGEPAILLIHGSLARSEDWENVFPRLATRYRTVAYDLRGHGRSGRATDYSLRAFGDDALRVQRTIVKGPVVAIGSSLGALCAIALAAREPEQVLGIVLEDPNVSYGAAWDAARYKPLRDALDHLDDQKAFLKVVERWPLPSPGPRGERTHGELRGFYAADRMATYLRDVDPAFLDARTGADDASAQPALAEWLAAVRCPVLVLAGEPRLGSNLDDNGEWKLKRATKDLVVKRLPGTGHWIHGFRPEQFLENIEPFLRRLRTTRVA